MVTQEQVRVLGFGSTIIDLHDSHTLGKFDTILDFCVSSLRRVHANLLCIVPILTDDLQRGLVVYLCIMNR